MRLFRFVQQLGVEAFVAIIAIVCAIAGGVFGAFVPRSGAVFYCALLGGMLPFVAIFIIVIVSGFVWSVRLLAIHVFDAWKRSK
jgi:hypothetical protein